MIAERFDRASGAHAGAEFYAAIPPPGESPFSEHKSNGARRGRVGIRSANCSTTSLGHVSAALVLQSPGPPQSLSRIAALDAESVGLVSSSTRFGPKAKLAVGNVNQTALEERLAQRGMTSIVTAEGHGLPAGPALTDVAMSGASA